jgi:hypothetical protein
VKAQMLVQVEAARSVASGDGREIDAYIAPSGARYDYSNGRCISVHGHPTMIDEIMFVRHMSSRARGVRVLGVSIGDAS